jgi:uncharacterized protein (DUF2062 family)
MAPYYAATTEAAAWIMGVPPPSQLATQLTALFAHSVLGPTFWREMVTLLWPLFWPFVAGSTAAALGLGALAYRFGLLIATSRRARRAEA